jgi:glyoxylase-like metal-dependent hydrolase (beta-lactamase superfamily II)
MFGKLSLVAALAASVLMAQPQGKGGGQPVQPPQQIKPGFYMIAGAGATSGVRVTDEGVILVDCKLPGEKNYDDLIAQIKSVTTQPVKYLIVTHHHADHTGNDQKFLDAGVTIVGHDDLKKNLTTYQFNPRPASPNVTYSKDYVVKLGRVEAQVHHYASAHTSGDSVVYFPDVKVVMVSDEVTVGANGPLIDYAGGGTAFGFLQALDSILKLDFDAAIPGNGNPLTKADVQAFKTKFETVINRARELVKKGVPKDQLMAQIKTDDIGWSLRVPQVEAFYDELSKAK